VTDFQRVSQTDMIAAFKTLLDAQQKAVAARDAEAHEAADHEMSMFLRMMNAGRLQEWFATRAARTGGE
jgi:hypothetical protein